MVLPCKIRSCSQQPHAGHAGVQLCCDKLFWTMPRTSCHAALRCAVLLQERLNSNYAELSGAFKSSLEGLARTVQDLHTIIK